MKLRDRATPKHVEHVDEQPRVLFPPPAPVYVTVQVGCSLKEAKWQVILATVRACGWNVSRAARVLGVSQQTLYSRRAQLQRAREQEGDGA